MTQLFTHLRSAAGRALVSRLALVAVVLGAALIAAACEKPDAAHVTSPSVRALLGTTEGNVRYESFTPPPPDTPAPDGWSVDLGNVRFEHLENGAPTIQVVTQISSSPGPGMALWLSGPEGPVWQWSGGTAREYNGVVCFQVRVEEDGAVVPLGEGPLKFTMAFVEQESGEVIVAKTIDVAGFVPDLEGPLPGPEADAGRVLLGCPRAPV